MQRWSENWTHKQRFQGSIYEGTRCYSMISLWNNVPVIHLVVVTVKHSYYCATGCMQEYVAEKSVTYLLIYKFKLMLQWLYYVLLRSALYLATFTATFLLWSVALYCTRYSVLLYFHKLQKLNNSGNLISVLKCICTIGMKDVCEFYL